MSIEIESFKHQNPIPAATRIGPLIESGIIPPFNDGERKVPDSLEEMVANLFLHIGNILDVGGATWADVIKIMFFAEDPGAAKDVINRFWEAKFPDPASRPSRHTLKVPESGTKATIRCVMTAYVDA